MSDKLYNIYGIPNQIQNIPEGQKLALYVRYPARTLNETSYWTLFSETEYNKHQIEALKLFVESGLNFMDVSVPHCLGSLFSVKFTKLPRLKDNYNDIYIYKREDDSRVSMMISYPSQIGFINRVSSEHVG